MDKSTQRSSSSNKNKMNCCFPVGRSPSSDKLLKETGLNINYSCCLFFSFPFVCVCVCVKFLGDEVTSLRNRIEPFLSLGVFLKLYACPFVFLSKNHV